MGELRRKRLIFAWLAIFAVIGNIVASAFCCSPSLKSEGEIAAIGSGAGVFASMVICTRDGLKTLLPTVPGDHDVPGTSKAHCPVCVLMASFALVIAFALLGFVTTARGAHHSRQRTNRFTFEHLRPDGPTSRGPPILA